MNRYQTFGKRFLAFLIDFAVFVPLIAIELWLAEVEMPKWLELVWIPATSVLYLSYGIILHWKYGQTLGKMATGVKVLDTTESSMSITLKQAFLRDVFYVVSEAFSVGAQLYLIFIGFRRNSDEVVQIENYVAVVVLIWFVLDVIVCLSNSKRRALHDYIAGTVVVRLDYLEKNEPVIQPE